MTDDGWGFADMYAIDETSQKTTADLADVRSDAWRNILVVGRATESGVYSETLSLVGHARHLADALGCHVEVLLIGKELDAATEALKNYAVDNVYRVEAPEYAPIDHTARILERVVHKRRPELVLLFQSRTGDAVTAYAANRLGVGYVVGASKVEIDTAERLAIVTHQGADPRFQIVTRMTAPPQFVNVQRGLFRTPMEDPYHSTNVFDLDIDAGRIADIRVTQREPPMEATLADAERVVVAGGRIHAPEDVEAARRLATALGAVFGVTQGVVDRGLADEEDGIVGTGYNRVAPKLFVAVGVAGALDVMEAIDGDPTIVAVASGEDDPINERAAYRVGGSVRDAVQEILDAL